MDDTQLQDVLVLHTLLMVFATARSVDRLGATSTTPLMASAQLYWTLTHTMWTVSPSHLGTLVNIFGHMPLEYLMITITMVITTVPVPHTLVPALLPLLDWIISVNLESLVDGKTTIE